MCVEGIWNIWKIKDVINFESNIRLNYILFSQVLGIKINENERREFWLVTGDENNQQSNEKGKVKEG